MHNKTRELFNALMARHAELNGIPDASQKFNVTPDIEITLEQRIQEGSEFLSRINSISVVNQKGRKVGVAANSTIAGRTNTNDKDRATQDPTGLDEFFYLCEQTNYDTHIPYAKLDAWRHHPEFQTLVRNVVLQQIARDRIMIGFNGTSAAVETDRATNPLLQDVNIGWLQKIRSEAPEQHYNDAANLVIGAAGPAYKNLDALVVDMVNELIDPWHREDTNLVAIMGRDLWAHRVGNLVNDQEKPTEKLAADVLIGQQKVGGLQAHRVPYFPADGLLITSYDNLSHYWQEGTRRRHIEDNAKRDRVEDYQSLNEAYVVEDYGRAAFIEGITMDGAGGADLDRDGNA